MAKSRTEQTRDEIRAAYRGGAVLAIDPDAHTPGAAVWSPVGAPVYSPAHATSPVAWVWGGNRTSAALSKPDGASRLLDTLGVWLGLLVIEAAITSGGAHAASMAPQNLVRGGWQWLALDRGVPVVLCPPMVWQYSMCGAQRGEGAYKAAYKAHARDALGVSKVNEDAAAALCLLEFSIGALGHDLPAAISLTPLPLS